MCGGSPYGRILEATLKMNPQWKNIELACCGEFLPVADLKYYWSVSEQDKTYTGELYKICILYRTVAPKV